MSLSLFQWTLLRQVQRLGRMTRQVSFQMLHGKTFVATYTYVYVPL